MLTTLTNRAEIVVRKSAEGCMYVQLGSSFATVRREPRLMVYCLDLTGDWCSGIVGAALTIHGYTNVEGGPSIPCDLLTPLTPRTLYWSPVRHRWKSGLFLVILRGKSARFELRCEKYSGHWGAVFLPMAYLLLSRSLWEHNHLLGYRYLTSTLHSSPRAENACDSMRPHSHSIIDSRDAIIIRHYSKDHSHLLEQGAEHTCTVGAPTNPLAAKRRI